MDHDYQPTSSLNKSTHFNEFYAALVKGNNEEINRMAQTVFSHDFNGMECLTISKLWIVTCKSDDLANSAIYLDLAIKNNRNKRYKKVKRK